MPGSPKDRLIRATLWHAAGRVAAGLLGIVNAAWAFHALGPERYGLLAVTAVFSVALLLVEFGLRTSTVHFASEEAARADPAVLKAVLGSATLLHLAAGSAVALPFLLFPDLPARALGVAEPLRAESALLLRSMSLALVVGNAASSWTSLLVAMQRTGPMAAGMVLGGVAQLAGTVAGIRLGWGAPSLAAGFAAGTIARAFVEAGAGHRLLPGVSCLPWHATRTVLGRLLSQGRHLQVARVADVFVFNVDQVLVARFLGGGAAGVYRLASDLVLKVREAPLLFASGVLPAASEVKDADGGRALRNLYVRGTKYVAAAAALAAAFLAAAAPEVLRAAGGAEAAAGAAVFAILMCGIAVNATVGVGTQVGIVLGHAGLQARAGILSAAVSAVGVPAALLAGFGLRGAAAATAIALVAGAVVYLRDLHRALGLAPGEALRAAWLPPVLPAAGVAGAVLLLHRGPLAGFLAGAGRGGTLAVVAAEGAVLAGVYAAVLWFSGWADAFDRDVLGRLRPTAPGTPSREPER